MMPTYDRAVGRLVACRIKQRRATTPNERYRANGALDAATRAAITEWLKTTPGTQARARYSTCPNLLQATAIAAVIADARAKERLT
jgi:hypothetical protein